MVIKIIHIDKDEVFLNVISSMLYAQNNEFEVHGATTIEQVLSKMKTELYDIVLSEYELDSNMNVLELLYQTRNQGIYSSFIILTNQKSQKNIINALNAGIDFYIKKSVNLQELFLQLNAVLHQAYAKRQLDIQILQKLGIFEMMNEGIIYVDNSGHIIDVNTKFLEMVEYDRGEVIDKEITEFYSILENHSLLQEMKLAWSQNTSEWYNLPILTKSGKNLWLQITTSSYYNETGEIIGTIGIYKDITKQINAEESKLQYEAIVYHMNEGLIQADIDDNIIFVNNRLCEMTGYKRKDLVGRYGIKLLLFPEDEEVVKEKSRYRLKGHSDRYEIRLRKKDGSFLWVLVSGTPVYDINGKIIGSIGIFTDIDQLKITHQQLLAQNEELRAFAHDMLHDLRNSLSIIDGYSTALIKKSDPEFIDRIKEQVKLIQKVLTRSVELAEAGLTVERFDIVDLNLVLSQVIRIIVPKNIEIRIVDFPLIKGENEKIFQIFKNLLENAVVHGKPSKIEINKIISEEGMMILVSNDGNPLTPDIKTKIIESQTTGRGLKIIKKLVSAHGWTITLDPTSNTTFRILIPNK